MSDRNDSDAPTPIVPFGIERAIAAVAIGAIFVISLGNTVVRYVTNQSFAFTEEYSIFLVVVMTFAGTATAFALHRNIAVTFIRDAMPRRLADVFDIVAALASLLMFGLIAFYGGRLAYEEWYYSETSAGLGNPAWIYTVWMPLLAVVVMGRIVERWVTGRRKRRNSIPAQRL